MDLAEFSSNGCPLLVSFRQTMKLSDQFGNAWGALLQGFVILIALTHAGTPAMGQAQLADELVILSKGQTQQNRARDESVSLGGGIRVSRSPGADVSRLEPRGVGSGAQRRQQPDVLTAAAQTPYLVRGNAESQIVNRLPTTRPEELPPGRSLELPRADEDGPPDGLTLDMAIDLLVNQSLSLQGKYQEIPKAQADILTAGLRGNPLVFGSVDSIPYRNYSPQRPGETNYGITIIQPIDINRKRVYRTITAQWASNVVEAQYQDAVRLEIDTLASAFIDTLAARETVRYVDASLVGLRDILNTVEKLVAAKESGPLEVERIKIQIDSAEIAHEEALAGLMKAKRRLALLLNMPSPDECPFEITGTIRQPFAQVPEIDDLVALATSNRPDLKAFQLGVHRAESEVDLARKEAYPDVFVLYAPYELRDNGPTGGQNASSWSLSAMASIPIFNRNQGNIRRAEINVGQTRTELATISLQIENEVKDAHQDYFVARQRVDRLEKSVLLRAKNIRDKSLLQLKAGEIDALTYLQSQRDYVDVVRQFRDALVVQRRTLMRLNTVVGLRVIP